MRTRCDWPDCPRPRAWAAADFAGRCGVFVRNANRPRPGAAERAVSQFDRYCVRAIAAIIPNRTCHSTRRLVIHKREPTRAFGWFRKWHLTGRRHQWTFEAQVVKEERKPRRTTHYDVVGRSTQRVQHSVSVQNAFIPRNLPVFRWLIWDSLCELTDIEWTMVVQHHDLNQMTGFRRWDGIHA